MELKQLSEEFYNDYNQENYPNILRKETRGYSIIILTLNNNVTFGIPVKTNLTNPKCGFLFNESNRRNNDENPGLDYMFSIVIKDKKYLGNNAIIDNKEKQFIMKNKKYIIEDYKKYVNDYIKFIKSPVTNFRMYWLYSHTSLQYFWNELGIEEKADTKDKIELAKNIFNTVSYIRRKANLINKDLFISIKQDGVYISYNSLYIIKSLNNENIKDYVIENFKIDKNNEIHRSVIPGVKMKEIINEINRLKNNQNNEIKNNKTAINNSDIKKNVENDEKDNMDKMEDKNKTLIENDKKDNMDKMEDKNKTLIENNRKDNLTYFMDDKEVKKDVNIDKSRKDDNQKRNPVSTDEEEE